MRPNFGKYVMDAAIYLRLGTIVIVHQGAVNRVGVWKSYTILWIGCTIAQLNYVCEKPKLLTLDLAL